MNKLSEKSTPIVTLKDLLSERQFFRVPDYQRGYAWHNEFEILWKDILLLYKRSKKTNSCKSNHYTGMLVLAKMTDDEKEKEFGTVNDMSAFYIVDGQQRIASLVIILSSLLKNIPDELQEEHASLLKEDGIYRFAYFKDENSSNRTQKYFEDRIYQGYDRDKATNSYLQNIDHAKVYIEEQLKKRDIEEIKEILNIILNNIVFNLYFVSENFDVRVTFETMNNRGKKLSNLELLKNRLMYLSTFFNQYHMTGSNQKYEQILMKKINTVWTRIYENLSYGDSYLSDDVFLKAHWIVYRSLDKAKGDSYFDFILNKYFAEDQGKDHDFYNCIVNQESDKARRIIEKYISSLDRYSGYWAIVNKPEVDSVAKIKIPSCTLELLKKLNRETDNIFVRATIMVVIASNEGECRINDFLEKLELSWFINKIIGQSTNDYSFLISKASALMEKNGNDNSKDAYDSLYNQLENHDDLGFTKENAVRSMKNFINLMENKDYNFYSWNGIRYFLFEYNLNLNTGRFKDVTDNFDEISVEHILPQTPETKKTTYWKTAFSDYIDNDDFMKKLINALGNLIVLSNNAENSSLSNYSFPIKCGHYQDEYYFSYYEGTNASREIARNESMWTIAQIWKYSDKLFWFMYSQWFSRIKDFSEEEWLEYEKMLIVFRDKVDFDENNKPFVKDELRNKLEKSNYEKERETAYNKYRGAGKSFEKEPKIRKYFDEDEISLKFNEQRVSFKKSYFSCMFFNDDKLMVKVSENNENIEIQYDSSNNKICIYSHSNKQFWKDYNKGFQKIDTFIKSFFRYIEREEGQKNSPVMIQDWLCIN